MATAADKDPVLSALPAEVRERVERTLQSYDTPAAPSLAFPLFPAQPGIGDTDFDSIRAAEPALPKAPPRKPAGPRYVSGSQPRDWVARSIKQSAPRPVGVPGVKPLSNRRQPAWASSPSGRWRTKTFNGTTTMLVDRRA